MYIQTYMKVSITKFFLLLLTMYSSQELGLRMTEHILFPPPIPAVKKKKKRRREITKVRAKDKQNQMLVL